MLKTIKMLLSLFVLTVAAGTPVNADIDHMPAGGLQSKMKSPFRWFFDFKDIESGKDLIAQPKNFGGIELPTFPNASMVHFVPDMLTVATDRVHGEFEISSMPHLNQNGSLESLAIDVFLQTRMSEQSEDMIGKIFPNADDRFPMAEISNFSNLVAGNSLQVIWDQSEAPKLAFLGSVERVRIILTAAELNEYRCLLDAHEELSSLPKSDDEDDHLSPENALSILMGKLVQGYKTYTQEISENGVDYKWIPTIAPYTMPIDNRFVDASGRSLHQVMLAIIKKYVPSCGFTSSTQRLNEVSFPEWKRVRHCAKHHNHHIRYIRN